MSVLTITAPDGTCLTPASEGWLGLEALLSEDQVAGVLLVSPRTVGKLRRAGKLPGVLIGRQHRYDPADVRAFIESCKTTGGDA